VTRVTIINIALCEDTRLSERLKKKLADLDTWTSGNFQNKSFAWSHVGVVCWRTIPACAFERKNENISSSSMSWQGRTNNPHVLYCRSLSNANVSLLLIGIEGFWVGFQPWKNPVECTVITKPQASIKWVSFWQVLNSYYFIMYKKTKGNTYLDTAQRNSPVNLILTLAIFSKLL